MAGGEPEADPQASELIELAREIRERVRAQHPTTSAAGTPLPDLLPVLHARDRAEAKVASIGTVNPREPGLLNSAIQAGKRVIARLLDWHVREQVEYNRAVLDAINAILEALNENNRALARIAAEAAAGRDAAAHWAVWRPEWERRSEEAEIHILRSLAEMQAAFQQQVLRLEESLRRQHQEYGASLSHAAAEIQRQLWQDLEKAKVEFERLIHGELRILRQRMMRNSLLPAPAQALETEPAGGADSCSFACRFRGSEEEIRRRQAFYLPFFQGLDEILDLGCGRGEFLELMRDAGLRARGADSNAECVEICRAKGLEAEHRDLFETLLEAPESSLGGIFCSHVVEHLPPSRLPELIRLAASRLHRDGLLAIETPNPECLATMAAHFYLDPTHRRPVPAALLKFYMEEFGFGGIQIHPLSPAVEFMPSLASLPADFREAFFGGLDYAILGRKL